LLRLQGVLTHLELMGAHLHDLAEHLRRKIRIGAIFLDKDVIFLNNLFSRQTGLLRTLVDVMKRDNQLLRTYLRDESSRLIEDCFSVREHHELQMMDSHVHPEGWGLFIGMLEQMQAISKHLLETLKFLEK
jgi:Na+/phosphate symporter